MDIRLWEVGAKRPLNGTSKVNTQTDTQTFRLIESIGPEGRCFEKAYQNKIIEALEMAGIQYISNPRPDRKGGGAAITLISGELTLSKLNVLVPKNLEVV